MINNNYYLIAKYQYPEIEFYETNYRTSKNMQTSINNLFVAGDGVGKSRGIVGAGLTGILAAKGILKNL